MGSPADELVEVIGPDGWSNGSSPGPRCAPRTCATGMPSSSSVRRTVGVHQRADWKDVYPSLWDIAFGGVPGVGESDDLAAVRELAEEAGLDVDTSALRRLGVRERETDAVVWRGVFYVVTTDAALHPADGEVARMEQVPVGDLRAWSATHELCPDVVALLDDAERWLG